MEFTKKENYFYHLTNDLAAKYSITPHEIRLIRSEALGRNKSREDIMDWADGKLRFYKRKHLQPKHYLKPLFDFLEDLSDEAWVDITQLTPYDKPELSSNGLG